MNYQELQKLYHKNPVAFYVAMTAVLHHGKNHFASAEPSSFIEESNLLSSEMKKDVAADALAIAQASESVIFAIIQRELPTVESEDGTIPPLHEFGDEEDICPLCGAEIEYEGDNSIDDGGTIVSWTCPECDAIGQAGYNSAFDRHYNVRDKNGNLRPEEEK